MPDVDYFVATFDDGPRPHVWRWEIVREGLPMGVKLGDGGYRSRMAAEFAGARVLKNFLTALAIERTRARLEQRRLESIGTQTVRRSAV